MSKPPLWAVLPRPRVRPRARTLYSPSSFPFTTMHHAPIDGPALPPLSGSGRPSGSGAVRMQSSPSSSSQSTVQQDGLSSLYFDMSAPGTSPTSSYGPTALQMSQYPQPPPTPPLQPPPVQAGPRSLPLPLGSTTLPSVVAAMSPMSYYQQFLATLPPGAVAAFPNKNTRAAFAFDCAAYGIPKQRARTLSPSPTTSPSYVASSIPRGSDVASSPAESTDLNLAVQVGEDAYFLLPNALGVSDGVGGWAHRPRGLDTPARVPGAPSASAMFSRRLMHFCADEISALAPMPDTWSSPGQAAATAPVTPASTTSKATPDDSQGTDVLEPVAILQRAYTRAIALSHADHLTCGSSTALLAILLGDELRVAHLGDCALCLVRDGQMVYRSEEQQWKFNHPLQLGPSSSTTPSDAQRIVLKVKPDDILILSSDGMSDNLWDEDVLDEVEKFTTDLSDLSATSTIRRHAMPALLSEALCSRAKSASEVRPRRTRDDSALQDEGVPDTLQEVPFARRAREEGLKFSGGKPDDISVLVAMISAKESADDAQTNGHAFEWSARAPLASPRGLHTNLTFLSGWSSH